MARFSFAIFGQTTSELLTNLNVTIKDSNNSVVAGTQESGASYTLNDNQDGTYYVDNMPSGIYSVFVSNNPQDELTNIYFPTEDISTHINDATKHRVINDSSASAQSLFSATKINTLLTGKADSSHNHNGVYSVVAHNHEGVYPEEAGDGIAFTTSGNKLVANVDFHADDLEIVSGKLRIKQNFTSSNYINSSNPINTNLGVLDAQVKGVYDQVASITGVTSYIQYRQVYSSSTIAGSSSGNEASVQPEFTEVNNHSTYKTKVRFSFTKKAGDTKIVANFKGKGSGTQGSPA
tara:strand:- start:1010 stop:1885 length:876 start_codon:yes stop_codon:yes gene_type:complete